MINEPWKQLVDNLVKRGILTSNKVIKAMKNVARNNFLPEYAISHMRTLVDAPLPIGSGQTVSAPHMVGIMNETLHLEVGHRVLEVGAGCGWHAATIGEIVAPKDIPQSSWGHVYTIEILPELAQLARENILRNGFGDRVTVVQSDGSLGYSEHSPYDRILVTAAAPDIPPPLINQLKINGALVIPIGSIHLFQSLILLRKKADGELTKETLGGVAFVPLVGHFGHST